MDRRWSPISVGVILTAMTGCAVSSRQAPSVKVDPMVETASLVSTSLLQAPLEIATPARSGPPEADLDTTQPMIDDLIRRALAENRTVQAAYHNVQSLRHRIPQVVALDDPILSNTIFPIPSVAPQYSMMGYNPYNVTLAQQFPWFGTLRLRGQVAERDVQVALAELAAAQLDTVAAVKRAYFSLYASLRTEEILRENRKILEDFRAIARERLAAGGTQQDVIRAEILMSDLDRELASNQQNVAAARAALARQVHARPDTEFRTPSELSFASVPDEFERLYQLAIAARPELRGRLAAVGRDEKAVELARKRFYPNVTLGLTYMNMEKTNAESDMANGMPNVGLFVAMNLPVYRDKYRAGVCEAQERAIADAKLYEAQQDDTASEIQDLLVQARVQQNTLTLLRDGILPRTQDTLELARSDYAKSNVDFATAQSALREVLQIQVQVAQTEAELGRALASLERAVGAEINAHPVTAIMRSDTATTTDMPVPLPPSG